MRTFEIETLKMARKIVERHLRRYLYYYTYNYFLLGNFSKITLVYTVLNWCHQLQIKCNHFQTWFNNICYEYQIQKASGIFL